MQITQNYNRTQSFGAFLRFKDTPEKIMELRTALQNSEKYTCVNIKKTKKKYILDALSGKDFDKLLDISKDNENYCFLEIRTNLPKFLNKKPKIVKVDKFIKKLDKNA